MVLLALFVAAALSLPDARRTGDNLQIALPLAAFGCSLANGTAAEYALRFAAMMAVAHGAKHALGDAAINQRPYGGGLGFPSAHSSAAALGASAIVHDCVAGNPVVQAAAVLSAGFVGASRIEARAHNIWQVIAGWFLGWLCDRAFRGDSRMRRRIVSALAGVARRIGLSR